MERTFLARRLLAVAFEPGQQIGARVSAAFQGANSTLIFSLGFRASPIPAMSRQFQHRLERNRFAGIIQL